MATPISGVNRWLTLERRAPILFAEGSENAQLNLSEYRKNTIYTTGEAPLGLTLWIDHEELQTERYGVWNWTPIDFAGLYHFAVQTPDGQRYETRLRVFPRHITRRHYETMQAELSEIALDLLLRLDSPASERAIYAPRQQEISSLHEYQMIQGLISELRDVMAQISRAPHRALRDQRLQQDWQALGRFSAEAIPVPGLAIALALPVTQQHGSTYLPATWSTLERNLTYDTYENRLLKQFLQKQLVVKLGIIEERIRKDEQRLKANYQRYHDEKDRQTIVRLQQASADCHEMRQRCIRWSSEAFLRDVQPHIQANNATQVLLKHPTYSRFYSLYLRFQQRLKVSYDPETSVNELALRRVSELYEMWSVFTLTRIAIEILEAAGYRMTSNTTFYEVNRDYFQFQVKKNTPGIIMARGDLRIEFKYEPIYPNQSISRYRAALVATTMGSNPLTPDLAIEVYRDAKPRDILVFDAKYRRDQRHEPLEDDIDKMYRYQKNIQYQNYVPGRPGNPHMLKKIVSSAYILHPGEHIYTEADDHIGALPLKPGITAEQLDEVREQVKDLLYDAYVIDE